MKISRFSSYRAGHDFVVDRRMVGRRDRGKNKNASSHNYVDTPSYLQLKMEIWAKNMFITVMHFFIYTSAAISTCVLEARSNL